MESSLLLNELRQLIQDHAEHRSLPIEGLQLARLDAPTAPVSSIASPILAVVAQGSKQIVFDDRVYDYGAGDYLVVSVDLPVSGHFPDAGRERPFLGVGIDLQPDLIASLLMQNPHAGSRSDGRASTAIPPLATSRAPAELLDAVVRLTRLLDHPSDAPVLAPLIQREIAWRLLTGAGGAVVRQIGLTDGSFSQIGRSVRWIRDHAAESFRVEDLADQASMSLSTFHRRFRAVTSMSPVQFQKKVRLQQARLLLLGQAFDVSRTAFAVGYDSPSQFVREYRREFGAPPGRDAAQLRDSARQPTAALP